MFVEMPVRIVVLDYAIPGLDGMQVTKLMKQIKPDVPIIMLSACPDAPDGSAALRCGSELQMQLYALIRRRCGGGRAVILRTSRCFQGRTTKLPGFQCT
jgi:DNA-binding response OmpR family regulator